MRKSFFIALLYLLFFVTAEAQAANWEFITYGGYDATVNAFRKIALIFSDNAYKGLFFGVIILGILFSYISVLGKAITGGKFSFPLSAWVLPVLLGIMFYFAFILPKDQVTVYDETLNRGPETINNIPRGIATIAGILNKVEKGLIDIIDTSSSTTSYRLNSGGTGFALLDFSVAYTPLSSTLSKYFDDCIVPELYRADAQVTVKDLTEGLKTANEIV